MSSQEWERWKATYEKGGGSMPNVIKRAKTDRMRFLLGMLGLHVLSALQVLAQIPRLRRAHSALEHADPAIIIATTALILASAHIAMRGTLERTGERPVDLIAAMERRNAGRLLLVRAMPWIMAFTIASSLAVFVARAVTHQVDVADESAGLVLQGAGVAFVLLVLRRFRRDIGRDMLESAEARRLLASEPPDAA
jgi:hypothetical protein